MALFKKKFFNKLFIGKALTFILVGCIVSGTSLGITRIKAENTVTKKMFHYKRTVSNDENCIIQRVSNTLKPDTEYTFSFKYNLISGEFISINGAGIYIGIFGHDTTVNSPSKKYGNSFLRMTGNRFQSQFPKLKNFTTAVVGEFDATYTFTLSENDLENISDLYAGFYFVKAAVEFNAADITLYETGDKDKTNLLCNGDNGTSLDEWYSYSSSGSGLSSLASYVDYDSKLFSKETITGKTMFSYKRTESGDENCIIQRLASPLKADTEYVFSFKYNLKEGTFVQTNGAGIYIGIFGHNSNMSTTTIKYGNSFLRMTAKRFQSQFPKLQNFSSETVTDNSAFYTFTLSESDLENISDFYAGFYFVKSAVEFDIADMVIYEKSDALKTNLLYYGDEANSLEEWYNYSQNGASLSKYAKYVQYDSKLFPEEQQETPSESDVKTMLSYKRDISTDENCLIERVNGLLKSDTEYTFSFKYHLTEGTFIKSGGAGIYVGLFGHDSTMSTSTMKFGNSFLRMTGNRFQSQFPKLKSFSDLDIDDGSAVFKFSLSEDDLQGISDYYLGFYFLKCAVEFDIADMVLYETNDAKKTNLLCRGSFANDMTDWYSFTYTGSELDSFGKYVPFDETLFPKETEEKDDDEEEQDSIKMLHYTRSSKNENKLVQKVNGLLKPNTKYGLELDLHFEKGSAINGVSIGVFSDSPYGTKSVSNANKMLRVTRYGSAQQYPRFETTVTKGKHLKYTFTLSEQELDSATANYVGFYFKLNGDVDFYAANIVLYEYSDAKKTNLLPNDNKSSNLKVWYDDFNKASDLDDVEYVNYNAEYFKYIKKMFSFKNGANQVFFAQRFTPVIGDTYYFRFSIACSQLDDIDVRGTLDSDRQRFPSGVKQVSRVDHKYYSTFTYSITVPEKVGDLPMTSVVFAGIMIPSYSQGYVFDVSLWNKKDKEKIELFQNPDFSSGLDLWTWGMPIWFIPEKNGYGLNYFSEDGNTLEVVNYSLAVVEKFMDSLNIDDGKWWNQKDIVSSIDKGTATLNGFFKDQNGAGIDKATFFLYNNDIKKYTAVSSSSGAFYFKDFEAGYYELMLKDNEGNAVFTGYSANFEKGDIACVTVTSDTSLLIEEKDVDTKVKTQVGSFKGTVYTPDIKVVPNIKMVLESVGETVTDENGSFAFNDVPVGDYELYTLLNDGSKYVFKTVSIKDGVELSSKLKLDIGKPIVNQEEEDNSFNLFLVIGIAIAAVLIITATATIIIKKRRKN